MLGSHSRSEVEGEAIDTNQVTENSNSHPSGATDWQRLDRPRSMAAGACSLAFHALGLVLVALVIRPVPTTPEAQPERAVQIVLTPGSAGREYQDRWDSTNTNATTKPTLQPAHGADADIVPSLEQISGAIPADLALPANQTVRATGGVFTAGRLTRNQDRADRIPIAGDLGKFIAEEQARVQAGRPVGDPTAVTLFGGQPAAGRSFLFLIDRSKSMQGQGALGEAEKELLVALRPLQAHHTFQVIAYHHQCVFLQRRALLPGTEENKESVRGFLSGLAPFGTTEHEMALQTALSHAPDVIYLLTDGGDPELTDGQIRQISKLAAGRTTIHCVHFGLGSLQSDNNFLQRLAKQNRGTYQYVDLAR